jgi:hypothetical protein
VATAKPIYVFGVVTRGDESNLVFIPEPEAKRLAAIYDAISAKTWGEFKRRMPTDDLQEVISYFVEDEEEMPSDDAKFEPDLLPGFCDGDWPDWTEQRMLEWVPRSIIQKYATMMTTAINESYPVLDVSRKDEIVAAIQNARFECREDQELVRSACRG